MGNGRSLIIPDSAAFKLAEQLRDVSTAGQYEDTIQLLTERLADLELAIEDEGWQRVGGIANEREFSGPGLTRIRRLARLMFLKNPLINHGVRVQANYVWGQGASFSAPTPEVNDVIQSFLDHPENRRQLTGHAARKQSEIELQVEGELFLALLVNPMTGFCRIRKVHPDDIEEVVTNPDDESEVWFYRRVWSQQEFDTRSGATKTVQKIVWHPDVSFDPQDKPPVIGGSPVEWGTPIMHVKVGGFSYMRRGVPEIYAAIDWARSVVSDLETYATIQKALARFVWNLKTKGGKTAVAAAKTRLSTTLDPQAATWDTNPAPVAGSTFIASDGAQMEPMKTSGVGPNPETGRRLWLMVSAGLGIPETILSGDANVGNLATATSLDRPTELQMQDRQTLWADVFRDLLNFVVKQAVMAVQGPLPGQIVIDRFTGEEKVLLAADEDGEPADPGIEIDFPSVLQRDMNQHVDAIVKAATLGNTEGTRAGTMDDRTLIALLQQALGNTDDIDEMLELLAPDNGTVGDWQPGTPPPPPEAPEALVAALREFREAVKGVLPQLQLVKD